MSVILYAQRIKTKEVDTKQMVAVLLNERSVELDHLGHHSTDLRSHTSESSPHCQACKHFFHLRFSKSSGQRIEEKNKGGRANESKKGYFNSGGAQGEICNCMHVWLACE